MTDFICPIMEFAVIIPGALIAYLPMKRHMKMSRGKLALMWIPALILICMLGGSLSYLLNCNTIWVMIPAILLAGYGYCRTLNISFWKSISVILAVCGVFSCIYSIANAIDAIICSYNKGEWFCLGAGLIYNLFCWIFVILVCYPATHAVCDLLENEEIVQSWYVFWILPAVFISLNLFLTPLHIEILYQGRTLLLYIVNSLMLLSFLLLFYWLFYYVASALNRNYRLRQENQFLNMQQTQYEMLCSAIEETRQARHDMRHHFSTLAALANRKEWQQLEEYIAQVQESIPSVELNLCDNPAVDGVASHYAALIKGYDIPFSAKFNLPYNLLISEMDICLVLSNLLENALEASLRTDISKRCIKVQAYIHSDNVILITVENAFEGNINKKNDVFQSSKHSGSGVGIQSVRRIAERNGGYCRFMLADGKFTANIMLRGSGNNQKK